MFLFLFSFATEAPVETGTPALHAEIARHEMHFAGLDQTPTRTHSQRVDDRAQLGETNRKSVENDRDFGRALRHFGFVPGPWYAASARDHSTFGGELAEFASTIGGNTPAVDLMLEGWPLNDFAGAALASSEDQWNPLVGSGVLSGNNSGGAGKLPFANSDLVEIASVNLRPASKPVPEPGSLVLLGFGLLNVSFFKRQRRE